MAVQVLAGSVVARRCAWVGVAGGDLAVAEANAAAGATPVAAATDRPWGGRSAFIADPEGNRWEIIWGPEATFDERGALLTWG